MNSDELFREGRFEEALQSYSRGLKTIRSEDAIPTNFRIAECLCKTRRYARARNELAKLKNSPTLHQNPLLFAEYLILFADVNMNLGNYEEARVSGEEAFGILRKTDENELIARVQQILGIILLSQGNLEKAKIWFEDLLSTCRRTGNEERTLFPLNGLAQLHFCGGRWSQALECLERGLEVGRKVGDEGWTCAFLLNLGTVHRKMSNWSAASRYLAASIEIGRNLGDGLQVLRGELSLASLCELQRDWKKASRLLKDCRIASKKEGYKRELCLSHEGLGKLAFAQANRVEAENHYKKAYQIATEICPEGDLAVELSRCLADLYIILDKPVESLRYTSSALRAARKLGDRFEEACIYRTQALAYQKLNQSAKAQQLFSRAVQLFEKLGDKYERARTFLESGKLMKSRKNVDGAVRHLLQAEELFRAIPSEYWVGVTLLELAVSKFCEEDLDSTITYVNKAQELLEEIGEKETVDEASRLREMVEKKMIESALLAVSHYATPDGDFHALIRNLTDEIKAERAFLILNDDSDFEVKSLHNIEEEEARRLCFSLNGLHRKRPLISTNLHLDRKYPHLQTNGTFSFMLLPFGPAGTGGVLYVDKKSSFNQRDLVSSIRLTHSIALKNAEVRQKELKEENLRLHREIQRRSYPEIVTRSKRMFEILALVDKIKDDSAPVLILGETGTGKELIAKALHYKGRRKSKPFVPLDCATPTETLAESEFFGHKRGSFTDAKEDKPGLFEQANGGSLFLDEVANLSEDIQAKLLRVLQEGKVRRIGETKQRKVDVRIIAASNKDLEREVAEGRFRKDLYYRLNGIRIHLPPLRERKEDIPLLVHHFVRKFSREKKKKVMEITESTMRTLAHHDWAGNVRELESEIERAVVLMENGCVTPDLLSSSTRRTVSKRLRDYSLQDLIETLDENQWVKRRAARALGIPESTLRKRLKTHGISRPLDVRDSGAH